MNDRNHDDSGRRESDFMELMAEPTRRSHTRSSSEQAIRTIYMALVPITLCAMVMIPMASVKTTQVWHEVSLLGDELEKAETIVKQEKLLDDINNATSSNELREKIEEGRKLGVFDDAERDVFGGESKKEVAKKVQGIRHALRTGDFTQVPQDLAQKAKKILGTAGVDAIKAKLRSMPREEAEALVMRELSKRGISVQEAKSMANGR